MNIISEFLGTIIQVTVFALIPFLVYLFHKRKIRGFFEYIGLKRSTKRANLLAIVTCLLFAAPPLFLTLISNDFREIMLDPGSITGKFYQMDPGLLSFSTLLLIAILKTAFAEEIFFRGFIAKRLIGAMGFQLGNSMQALIFGIVHAALFATKTDNLLFLVLIFIIPSIGAFVSAYLNEKLANGSIIPGWISHGLANVLSYGIVGFLI